MQDDLLPADDEDEEEDEEYEEEKPRAGPNSRRTPRRDDEDDEAPRVRGAASAKTKAARDEPKDQNRDFDPIAEEEDRKRKRKKRRDETLSAAKKAQKRRAFSRAGIGVKLIWISFALFMFSMALILVFFLQCAFIEPRPAIITAAGILGLLNWLLAAVGVGLCLSGPRSPGHWTYGISAAVAVLVHLVVLLTLVSAGKEAGIANSDEAGGNARWALLPTRLNATMFFMTAALYSETQGVTLKGRQVVSMITGVLEMIRTVLIMMLLSCLARAALDEDLAHKCTRAAGIASGGPGLLGLLILLFVAAIVETNAGLNLFTFILFNVVNMSVYAIVIGVMLPAFLAAREVNDACDEPFQSLIPKL